MLVTCNNCNNRFELSQEQINLIEKLKSKGASFGMLKCDSCGLSFSVNPQNINLMTEQEEELTWRSPISGSHSFVSFIDNPGDKAFYGCGETGVVWFNKSNFYKDIELIIKKYPHRANCYEKRGDDWYPSREEPSNIDELISSEEKEEIKNYERG